MGDVDPRVGEHLLDVLAGDGIAAYLQPATDMHPVTRTTTLPSRPTDRLYADREHLSAAKDFLAQLTAVPEQHTPAPEMGQPATATVAESKSSRKSDDETFASIVAGYHLTVDPTATPWPEAEDIDSSCHGAADMDTEPAPRTSLRRAPDMIDQDSLLDGLDTFGAGLPDDEADEGYTPPPPPPLPRLAGATALAIVSLAFGLLLLFWPELLPVSEQAALFLAFSAVVIGFVTLILRLRPGDEEDDDPDNGARV